MGATLDVYRRYRELLRIGAYDRLTETADEQWVETCVGLTGWTIGLDIAAANFAAGIASAFSELEPTELDVVEKDDFLVIRGKNTAVHTGPFLGIAPTHQTRHAGVRGHVPRRCGRPTQLACVRHGLELCAAPAVGHGARPSHRSDTTCRARREREVTPRGVPAAIRPLFLWVPPKHSRRFLTGNQKVPYYE
jgi:hypothetical protein